MFLMMHTKLRALWVDETFLVAACGNFSFPETCGVYEYSDNSDNDNNDNDNNDNDNDNNNNNNNNNNNSNNK